MKSEQGTWYIACALLWSQTAVAKADSYQMLKLASFESRQLPLALEPDTGEQEVARHINKVFAQ